MNALPGEFPAPTAEHAHTGAWVASVLRSRIADGQLTPGSKLSEQSLSASLGVSRNTLREAFSSLVGEGIVTRIANRGVFVAAPTRDDVQEIYRVRRMIEPAAVMWGEVSSSDLDAMDAIIAEATAAREAGSVPRMASANQALHRAVIAMSGSESLEVLMTRVLAQMRLVFHTMSSAPDFHSHYVHRNVDLVERLRAGQRAEAAEGLRSYLDAAEAELLEHLGD